MLDRTCLGPRSRRSAAPNGSGPGSTELRGLVHDLRHGLATLSYLVEDLGGEPELPPDARHRIDLMREQLELLLDAVAPPNVVARTEETEVRGLLRQLVSAAELSTSTSLRLRPGPEARVGVERSVLWRIVTNLVDNALRAAGPHGAVEVSVVCADSGAVVVEVADDGPGFEAGPRDEAAHGLGIVGRLSKACGARVHVRSTQDGVRVRLVFPPGGNAEHARGA